MENKKSKKLPISIFELCWYSLTGAVALWGLVYIVLGLIARFADVKESHNGLAKAGDKLAATFGLDFFGWGLIIFAIGMVLGTFVLIVSAKSADKEAEKAARRAARLGLENAPSEAPKAE